MAIVCSVLTIGLILGKAALQMFRGLDPGARHGAAQPRTFVATAGQSGLTVLAALRQWMPGASWSAVRKLLAGRHVAVNESLCLDELRNSKPARPSRFTTRHCGRPQRWRTSLWFGSTRTSSSSTNRPA